MSKELETLTKKHMRKNLLLVMAVSLGMTGSGVFAAEASSDAITSSGEEKESVEKVVVKNGEESSVVLAKERSREENIAAFNKSKEKLLKMISIESDYDTERLVDELFNMKEALFAISLVGEDDEFSKMKDKFPKNIEEMNSLIFKGMDIAFPKKETKEAAE